MKTVKIKNKFHIFCLATMFLIVSNSKSDSSLVISFEQCLDKIGEKTGLYFTVESGVQPEFLLGDKILFAKVEIDLTNINTVDEALFFLTNTVEIIYKRASSGTDNIFYGETNRFVITTTQPNPEKPLVSIRDVTTTYIPEYVLDKKLTVKYEGNPTDFIYYLNGLIPKVAGPKAFYASASDTYGADHGTKINVDEKDKTIREILTDCIPLEGYKRVVWSSHTDGNMTNPVVTVSYHGKDFRRNIVPGSGRRGPAHPIE